MFRSTLTRALLTVIAIGIPATARADFQYRITTTTGFDSGFVSISSGGGIANGTYGGFFIESSTGSFTSTPGLGDLFSSANRVRNTNGTTESITIQFSVSALTLPPSPVTYSSNFSGNWNSLSNGSFANASTYFGNSGTIFDLSNAINFGTETASGGNSFANELNGPNQVYSPEYSLTHTITITMNPNGELQYTILTEVTPVPEPATIIGAGIALASIGAFRFRKRRRPVA